MRPSVTPAEVATAAEWADARAVAAGMPGFSRRLLADRLCVAAADVEVYLAAMVRRGAVRLVRTNYGIRYRVVSHLPGGAR